MTLIRLPGLIDPHAPLRDPDATHKQDWNSGTAAALAGGFVCALARPNNSPSVVDAESLAVRRAAARSFAMELLLPRPAAGARSGIRGGQV